MRQHLKSAAERLALGAASLSEAYGQFRQTRLYVQITLSVAIVALGLVAQWLPYGPLERADRAFRWVTSHDSDLYGAWERVNRWVVSRGGWRSAGVYAWEQAVEKVEPAMRWLPTAGTDGASAPDTGGDAGSGPETTPSETAADASGSSAGTPEPARAQTAVGRQGRVIPVEGAVLYGFGWRQFGGKDELHEGIDLVAEAGAPVRSIADGKVLRVVSQDDVWGGLLEIQHGDEVAVYGGVTSIRVGVGDETKAGDAVALVAATAPGPEGSIGPHLHLEIRAKQTGLPVDPAFYLGLQGSGT